MNYRKQDDSYENRNVNCENCQNFFAMSPYKHRCVLIGLQEDWLNRKNAVSLKGVCDKFKKF